MRHRPEITEVGWSAAKTVVLVVVFLTLAGFTVASQMFSSARAGRIVCLENQRTMQDALDRHREMFAGNNALALDSLRSSYVGPKQNFGKCPADRNCRYSYDPGRGTILCPNPFHQTGM